MSIPIVSWIKWDKLDTLVCPCLRHLKIRGQKFCRSGVWVAQNEFPCSSGKCGKTGCRSYKTKRKSEPMVILITRGKNNDRK